MPNFVIKTTNDIAQMAIALEKDQKIEDLTLQISDLNNETQDFLLSNLIIYGANLKNIILQKIGKTIDINLLLKSIEAAYVIKKPTITIIPVEQTSNLDKSDNDDDHRATSFPGRWSRHSFHQAAMLPPVFNTSPTTAEILKIFNQKHYTPPGVVVFSPTLKKL